MKIRITKKFTMEIAHALHGYDGPCKNIHGHTYHLEVTIIGEPIGKPSPKEGMVIDFSDLKKIINEKIVNKFDHALVLNGHSPHRELDGLTDHFEKIIFADYQPTCENMMIDFKNKIVANLPSEVRLHNIKLAETPTSFSEWFADDNK